MKKLFIILCLVTFCSDINVRAEVPPMGEGDWDNQLYFSIESVVDMIYDPYSGNYYIEYEDLDAFDMDAWNYLNGTEEEYIEFIQIPVSKAIFFSLLDDIEKIDKNKIDVYEVENKYEFTEYYIDGKFYYTLTK